jgi:hypothetical protein
MLLAAIREAFKKPNRDIYTEITGEKIEDPYYFAPWTHIKHSPEQKDSSLS